MEHLKIACTEDSKKFLVQRESWFSPKHSYIDAAAVVITDKDINLAKDVDNLRLVFQCLCFQRTRKGTIRIS